MVILFKMLLGLVAWLGMLGLAMYCRGKPKLTNVVIVAGFIILFILGFLGVGDFRNF